MKKRVGTLNNISIVEGDPNLLTNKELLHKGGGQLSKRNIEGKIEDLGSGNGSSSNEEEYYFIVDAFNSENPYLQHLVGSIPDNPISFSFKATFDNVNTNYINVMVGMSGADNISGFSIPRIIIMPRLFKPIDSLDFFAIYYATKDGIGTKEEIMQIVDTYKKEVLQFQVTKEEYYENNFTNVEEILTAMGM